MQNSHEYKCYAQSDERSFVSYWRYHPANRPKERLDKSASSRLVSNAACADRRRCFGKSKVRHLPHITESRADPYAAVRRVVHLRVRALPLTSL